MKITVAMDSFKGSLSSIEAGLAVKSGVARVYPDAEFDIFKMADGGEGTVEAIISANCGEFVKLTVFDPLGRPIEASYGYIPEKKTAVIEMAAASGITLVSPKERDIMSSSTYGTGQLICDAVKKGCRRFIIGIGGSATNDGGSGMLEALGYRFLDKNGLFIEKGVKGLEHIAAIDLSYVMPQLKECCFSVACDVKNPLCGSQGCSAVYGPQKGAMPEMIEKMDKWLLNFASVTKKDVCSHADPEYPGAGAAGGMGFALMSYLGAELKSGIDLVMEQVGIERSVAESDIVITGEGRLDGQSGMGKVPFGIAKMAKKYSKTVLAFSGAVSDGAESLNRYGVDAFFSILQKICTLDEAMDTETAAKNLQKTATQVFRLIKTMKGD